MGSTNHLIHSSRLALILLDAEALQYSLAEDSEALQNLLGVEVPPEWFQARDLIKLRHQQITRNPDYQPWSLRAITLCEEGKMIGHIGFHTQPGADYLQHYTQNGIEFGFTVYPDYRRNGFAKEASLALMAWANKQHGVTDFILTIRPDNIPSLKLAQRLGFREVGSHIDEVDGLEGIYRLTL